VTGSLLAHRCPNGHLTYPSHQRCPECEEEQTGTVDLTTREGRILTWTTATTTPPGVREPNTLAIVEFEVDGQTVRVLGGTTTDDVSTDATVRPVYVEELRDPATGIRDAESQAWDGFRFEPVE